MIYTEEAVQFECTFDRLLGILARPKIPLENGVIVIVGGPQYRVGSHRQFVHLSRALATEGYATLRFDLRGMGDSEGNIRSFETVTEDISAAISLLQKKIPTVKTVTLWGLCDGASAALLYFHETLDSRISSLCLLNPWIRSSTSLARTQVRHYYAQRLRQKEFWIKLIRGGVAAKAFSGLVRNIGIAFFGQGNRAPKVAEFPLSPMHLPFQDRMAKAWNAFDGPILLLLSGGDYTAKEFLEYTAINPAWKDSLGRHNLIRHYLEGVDHTFSSAESRAKVEKLTLVNGMPPPPGRLSGL
jgi:uncharacterized protein